MFKKRITLFVAVLFVLSAVLTACTPAAAPTEAPVVEEPAAVEPTEPEPATEVPTEVPGMDLTGTNVIFWHVYGTGLPMEGMTALVQEFNDTNSYGITVEALEQGKYSDLEDKMNAAIQSGDLPNVVMAYTNALSDWYSIGAIADMNPMIDDAEYGLTQDEKDALYPSAFEAGVTPDGARVAYPMTQSANVVVYNFTWAQELGFENPPANAEEFKAQVCAAAAANAADSDPDNDGTGGIVYYPNATNWLHYLYAFGGKELNAAGDAYDFTSEAAVQTSLYLNDLRDNGCAFQTESYPNPEQAQRKALVTLSSSAGLPYYEAAFADANNADVWGFLPAVGPDGKQAVDAFQQMLGIVDNTPEQNMASWLFVKWLTAPEQQAKWIADYSGYLPTQSTTEPLLADYAAANTVWATGLKLASIGPAEPQTFPAWSSVRRAIDDAAAQLYQAQSEDEVRQILATLTTTANDLVKEVQ